jgi:hypothetical protein
MKPIPPEELMAILTASGRVGRKRAGNSPGTFREPIPPVTLFNAHSGQTSPVFDTPS